MPSDPLFLSTAPAFRAWLQRHHASESEITLRLAKKHFADRGVTYEQALEEALCFGWIDGVRRAFDADTFTQRYTPRRPRSNWSAPNVERVRRLIAARRMTKAGLAAFAARDQSRTSQRSKIP
jgi:uncharacterized protein YdeI (YjbR/CyaY-like superfamily)